MMGDSILSHQDVDVYSGLEVSPAQFTVRKRKTFSKYCVNKNSSSRLPVFPQYPNLKLRNFAEENVFNILANRTMLETEVWKTQMALNDELITAQVLEREEKKKKAIKYEELLEEVKKLSISNQVKDDKIHQLILQNSNLKKNICSLYKTAKSEVEQKNSLLLNTNEELDRLRIISKKKSHQSINENRTAKPLEILKKGKETSLPLDTDLIKEKDGCRKRRHKENGRSAGDSSNVSQETNKKCCKNNSYKRTDSKRHEVKNNIKSSENHILSNKSSAKEKNCYKSKKIELGKISEEKFLKNAINMSVYNKNGKTSKGVVSAPHCTDKVLNSLDIISRKFGNQSGKHISGQTEKYCKISKPSSERKVSEKLFPGNPNRLTCLPIEKKSSENDRASTIVQRADQNDTEFEDLSCPASINGNVLDDTDFEKTQFKLLNDKTTTNALFFGLLPIEIRQTFLEYEQKLIKMINDLKQSFVDYCSTKKSLLDILPEGVNQTFLDYEQRLIIITNRLKQTFINSCLTTTGKAQPNDQCIKIENDNSVSTLFLKQNKSDDDKSLDSEPDIKGIKSTNNNPKEELEYLKEEMTENHLKQNQFSKSIENLPNNKNDPSQEEDKNSDSTQKVPSFYREIFLSNDASHFVNKTLSSKSGLKESSDSSQSGNESFHSELHSSSPFHPSLSSVYYRRQLLKTAIQEKTEKGLSKSTKENIVNLYKYRKSKTSFVGCKKE